MSDVEERPICPLWPNRFFRGKFNLLQGDPGLGKTMVVCDIAARVSRGAEWPDGALGSKPANVIFITSEDDPADTLKPRLRRASADMDRIHILETAVTFDRRLGKDTTGNTSSWAIDFNEWGREQATHRTISCLKWAMVGARTSEIYDREAKERQKADRERG